MIKAIELAITNISKGVDRPYTTRNTAVIQIIEKIIVFSIVFCYTRLRKNGVTTKGPRALYGHEPI